MTAYEEVKRILSVLGKKESTIPNLRTALRNLVSKFRNPKFRQQLAAECGGKDSSFLIKREALSKFWAIVLKYAIDALENLRSKSKKVENQDYDNFASLLSSYSHEDDADLRPRLSVESLSKVRKFVFQLFDSNQVVAAVEADLLKILLKLCARKDFVGVLRPAHFEKIVDILDLRLNTEEDVVPSNLVDLAARVLEALVSTSISLGISMREVIVDVTLWMVVRGKEYFTEETEHTTLLETIVILLRVQAKVMYFEPDIAIASLKKYGSHMLRIARRMYSLGADKKDAAIGYLISHVIVCQVTGKFEGLPAGDFGDVGKGSLDKDMVNNLLQLVVTEEEIKKTFSEANVNLSRRSSFNAWMPLNLRQQRYLELCARLLACSQRLYLVEETWKVREDHFEKILESIQFDDDPESMHPELQGESGIEEADPLPLDTVRDSPFIKNILGPLWSTMYSLQPRNQAALELVQTQQSDQSSSPSAIPLEDDIPFPLLQRILLSRQEVDVEGKELDSLTPYLQVLCACAEAFPFGEVWSTCASTHSHQFPPDDPLCNDAFLIKASSPDDLAAVVFVVGMILESAGRTTGNSNVQVWSLRCLLQLAESSVCIAEISPKALDPLSLVWQSIWRSLLCQALQYSTSTRSCTPLSRGELTLALIEKIIKFGCTDLDCVKVNKKCKFLTSEHQALWNLPVLSDAARIQSSVFFDMLLAALCIINVPEESNTQIDSSLPDLVFATTNQQMDLDDYIQNSYRFKLMCFCIKRLSLEMKTETFKPRDDIITSILACCSFIVSGKSSVALRPTSRSGAIQALRVTNFSARFEDHQFGEKLRLCTLRTSMENEIDHNCSQGYYDFLHESALHHTRALTSWVSLNTGGNRGFISPARAKRIREFVVYYMFAHFLDDNEQMRDDDSEHELVPSVSLLCKLQAIRLCIWVGMSNVEPSDEIVLVEFVLAKVATVVDTIVDTLEAAADAFEEVFFIPCFERVMTELLVRAPRVVALKCIKTSMQRLNTVCGNLLEGFHASRTNLTPTTSGQENECSDLLSDSDDDGRSEDIGNTTVKGAKRSKSGEITSKKKKQRTSAILKTRGGANSIASILLQLEPTIETCSFVYEQLSAVELGNNGILIDGEGARLALALIITNFSIVLQNCETGTSPFSVCMRIIDELREGQHAGDMHFLAGYPELSLVLSGSVEWNGLSASDGTALTELLVLNDLHEERWATMRPSLMVQRLRAAITAYEHGGNTFRDAFRSEFAGKFVKMSMNSESTQVRLVAAHALGVVLRFLMKHNSIFGKVVEALLLNNQPQLGEPLLLDLCKAQTNAGDPGRWKNTSVSIKYCLLRFWGTLGGCAIEHSFFLDRLFDCLYFASFSRANDAVCQFAIQRMCFLRGYNTAESLINDESDCLWRRWVDNSIPLGSIPIAFSSNVLLSRLIRMGLISKIEKVVETATAEFVYKSVSSVLPICLSRFTPNELSEFCLSNFKQIRPELFAFLNALSEVCTEDSTAVPNLLEFVVIHLHYVVAYGIVESIAADRPSDLLHFVFDFAQKHACKDILHDSVKHLIKIQGRMRAEIEKRHNWCLTLLDLDKCIPPSLEWGKLSNVVRDGAVEFLLSATYWLNLAQVESCKVTRWRTLEMITRLVLGDSSGNSFCKEVALLALLRPLSSPSLKCCHLMILTLIIELMKEEIVDVIFKKAQDKVLIFRLVGTLLQVHGMYTESILHSINLLRERECPSEHSIGISIQEKGGSNGGVWAWDDSTTDLEAWLLDNRNLIFGSISSTDIDAARKSHDVIQEVLHAWIKCKPECAAEDIASFEKRDHKLEVLARLDEKFSLRCLWKGFASGVVDTQTRLSAAICRFVTLKESFHTNPAWSESLDLTTILLQQTKFMYSILKGFHGELNIDINVENYIFVRHMLEIVGTRSFPLALRLEVSKCIGCIGRRSIGNLASSCEGINNDHANDWLSHVGGERGPLMTRIVSDALNLLLEQVKSDNPLCALASLEACKAIASTQEGVHATHKMGRGSNHGFMKTLLSSVLKHKPPLLTPSCLFVENAIRYSKVEKERAKVLDWCWRSELWSAVDVGFDIWIRQLVSSIILCCYGGKAASARTCIRGGTFAFRALGRISAMSSPVATFLLPRILIDLLLSDSNSGEGEPDIPCETRKESWITHPQSRANDFISRCFTSAYRSIESKEDRECKFMVCKVMSTAIDFLRRISQKRFLEFSALQMNSKSNILISSENKLHCFGSLLQIMPRDFVHMFIEANRVASAIYYAEHALIETGFTSLQSDQSSDEVNASSIKYPETHKTMLPILRQCLLDLQEQDGAAAYSLQMATMEFRQSRFRLCDYGTLQSSPTEKLQLLSAEGSTTSNAIQKVAESLKDLGSVDVLKVYIDSKVRGQTLSEEAKNSLKEKWFESCLSSMSWTDSCDAASFEVGVHTSTGFFASLSGALTSLANEDRFSFEDHVATCRSQILSTSSFQSSSEFLVSGIVSTVEKLELLGDLESIGTEYSSIQSVFNRWASEASGEQASLPSTIGLGQDFTLAIRESIITVLSNLPTMCKNLDLRHYLTIHQWQSTSIAMKQGRLQFAESCLRRLENSVVNSENRLTLLKVRLEEAKIIECRGYYKPAILAVQLIENEINELSENTRTTFHDEWRELRADSLLSCGIWTRKHRVESGKYVQENYLMPAVKVCKELWEVKESRSNAHRLATSCCALAQNAATVFTAIHSLISSREWKDEEVTLQNARNIVSGCKSDDGDEKRHRSRATQLARRLIEKRRIQKHELGSYATVAIQAFAEGLKVSDNSGNQNWTQHVVQMISIWFSMQHIESGINDRVTSDIHSIPSYRFVPLTYQLFARMSGGREEDSFQDALQDLVGKMCEEHPYHCLVQLLALGGDHLPKELARDRKVLAAKAVMASIRQSAGENLLGLFHAYEAVTMAYHELAMAKTTDADRKAQKPIPISSVMKDQRKSFKRILAKFDWVPCILTQPPTVLENHKYGNFKSDPPGGELIRALDPDFKVAANGVSHPKIVTCRGTKGNIFKQLVKGNDDLRQDAVMQQVFLYTNGLMSRRRVSVEQDRPSAIDSVSRSVEKKMHLVTYVIVPLCANSGVLEFVANSQSLADYLTDKGSNKARHLGAHSRFFEDHWKTHQAFTHIRNVQGGSHDQKRLAFDEACVNISPAFRYFFVETFGHNLQAWHTARTAFTRSCAVSSIVGHMLGIGDRHLNNILIHRKTGELVHIDFGVAFEQGRNLVVPETIPFRLTRDIVDGMGPLGTEGTFTAAAEETTRILRANSDALLTILSAVVNDPLYDWKKGAEKAMARQEDGEEEKEMSSSKKKRSKKAPGVVIDPDNFVTHAIARVKEKLNGYEEGTSGEQQSIEGQVQLLINCARDRDNLCELFVGMMAWH